MLVMRVYSVISTLTAAELVIEISKLFNWNTSFYYGSKLRKLYLIKLELLILSLLLTVMLSYSSILKETMRASMMFGGKFWLLKSRRVGAPPNYQTVLQIALWYDASGLVHLAFIFRDGIHSGVMHQASSYTRVASAYRAAHPVRVNVPLTFNLRQCRENFLLASKSFSLLNDWRAKRWLNKHVKTSGLFHKYFCLKFFFRYQLLLNCYIF